MNVVFLSPHFPPQFFHFCRALRARGFRALGIGDVPEGALAPDVRASLDDYLFVPQMGDLDAMERAVGLFTWKHGRVGRIDSLNEFWLGVEAHLREAFHVPGLQPNDVLRLRSKSGMHAVFRAAHVPCPATEKVVSAAQVLAFGEAHGYPLVLKPDVGVGAARTFKVHTPAEVEAAFQGPLHDFVVQPFVQGSIVTYDGLTNREGNVIFSISHEYSDGVMEVVLEKRDIYFWTDVAMPPELERLGRACVEAFGLKERFFHLEFFRLADGSYCALEMNLRPPGGFITDMMNYACDVDVYSLWAAVLAGESLKDFAFARKYFVCHIARHWDKRYRRGREELVRLLGSGLLFYRELPGVFGGVMGDEMFLTRHRTSEEMLEAVRLIQERA